MEFRIWVEARLAGRVLERQLVAQVEREASGIGPEEIGLTLEEGKTVLRQVQARMIQTQVEAVEAAHRKCVQCGRNQRIKDRRTRCVRTVFDVAFRAGQAQLVTGSRLDSASSYSAGSVTR